MIDEHIFDLLFKKGFTTFKGERVKWGHFEYPSTYISFTSDSYEKERIEINISHGTYNIFYQFAFYQFEYVVNDDYLYKFKCEKLTDLYGFLKSFFDHLLLYKTFMGKINLFGIDTNPM